MTGHRARGTRRLIAVATAAAIASSGPALAQDPPAQPPAAEKPKPGLAETIGGALGGALAGSAATASGGPVAGAAGSLAGQKVGRGVGGFVRRLFGGRPKPQPAEVAAPGPAAVPGLAQAADQAAAEASAVEPDGEAPPVIPQTDPAPEAI